MNPIGIDDHLSETQDTLRQPEPHINQMLEEITNLSHNFIGYLAVEAELRSQHDRLFQTYLAESRAKFLTLKPPGNQESYTDGASEFGLETLTEPHLDKWWAIPVYVALGISLLNRYRA
jgi:hypothetical protein